MWAGDPHFINSPCVTVLWIKDRSNCRSESVFQESVDRGSSCNKPRESTSSGCGEILIFLNRKNSHRSVFASLVPRPHPLTGRRARGGHETTSLPPAPDPDAIMDYVSCLQSMIQGPLTTAYCVSNPSTVYTSGQFRPVAIFTYQIVTVSLWRHKWSEGYTCRCC